MEKGSLIVRINRRIKKLEKIALDNINKVVEFNDLLESGLSQDEFVEYYRLVDYLDDKIDFDRIKQYFTKKKENEEEKELLKDALKSLNKYRNPCVSGNCAKFHIYWARDGVKEEIKEIAKILDAEVK